MSAAPVTLINVLKVEPGKQDALVALLKQNVEKVVSTLAGWKATKVIAAVDGTSVLIQSEWETLAAVDAMRNDERMKAYFPKIREMASFEAFVGEAVFAQAR